MITTVEDLKVIIKRYLERNERIKEQQSKLKTMKDQKKLDEQLICDFMERNQLEDISSSSCRLNLKIQDKFKSITQKKAFTMIQSYYQTNDNEALNLIEYLKNNRDKTTVKSLRCLKPKKKKKSRNSSSP